MLHNILLSPIMGYVSLFIGISAMIATVHFAHNIDNINKGN